MIRIVISSVQSNYQQAQFDLSNHGDREFLIGDKIYSGLFENIGPVTVTKRAHLPEDDLLVIYCDGGPLLQKVLVQRYPDIEGMPDSAQLPTQNWPSL